MADLSTLITVTAVQTQLGETFEGVEKTQVEWLVERALAEIQDNVPGLAARIESGAVSAATVTGVGVDLVLNALDLLRTGLRVKSEQYPETDVEYFRGATDDLIRLTPKQIARLTPQLPAASGAYTVSLFG